MKILTHQARRKEHISLQALADKTGISKTTLNNIENQTVYPTIKQLELIAIALNTRITALFESKYK